MISKKKYTYLFYIFIHTINGDYMKVRLGYVAITKTLDNITSSSSLSYTIYKNLDDNDNKLYDVILSNLKDLKEIIIYNIKNEIHFYRMSSAMIPLATHNEVHFDYIKPYKDLYNDIGSLIKKANMRVDFHPNQFCVLNSTSPKVIQNTVEILKYHESLLKEFHVDNPLILLHVGSMAGGKKRAISRFISNFKKLPESIQKMIALENDDKVYTVEDVLEICEKLSIPCVLDYHHYMCNHVEKIENLLPRIFNTWKKAKPKIHFSSPKSKLRREFRSHHDYIDSPSFISFMDILKKYDVDVDIMLEAKAKDEALFKLIRELKYKTNYEFIDETSFFIC